MEIKWIDVRDGIIVNVGGDGWFGTVDEVGVLITRGHRFYVTDGYGQEVDVIAIDRKAFFGRQYHLTTESDGYPFNNLEEKLIRYEF